VETLATPTSAYPPQDALHDEPGEASLPDRSPRRSRWRVWVSLALALIALRLALPIVLAPMLASRLSRVLGTRVDVRDVTFAPIDAVVTLRGVTVHAPDAMGAPAGRAPAVVADRVRLDVQWLPLLHRAVLVRELVLESARIELDRLTGGGTSLETFLRADPASELPPHWTFALDRVVLRDSTLRLRGVADAEPAALEVKVRDAQVSTLPRRATAFGRAPNLRVDAAVEGGHLRVEGSSDLRADGVVLDARIRAKNVPLAPLRSYLSHLGWSGVNGRLSAQLHYRRDPARRDLLTGRVIARRVAVRVPALVEPALAVRRAVADVEGIDLLARRVTIASLTLHGATLTARPDLAVPIPLLDAGRDASATAPTAPRRARPDERDGKATPWRWTIARLVAPSGHVRFPGPGGGVGVVASLSAENLGPGAYWSPLRAWFRHGEGVAAFDGTARMTHGLVIDGHLTAGAIDVPALARAVGVPWADLAQAGRGAADLSVELTPGATDGSAVDAHGSVSVADLWVAGPDPTAFALGAGAMQLELTGILARGNGARRPGSIELKISDVTIRAPQVQLSRTPDGWVFPPFGDDANPTVTATAAAATAAAADQPPESSRDVQLAVAQVRTNGGRATLVDTAAEPPVTIDLALSEGWGRDLRLPGVTLGDFALAGSDRQLGALWLWGRGVDGRALELSGESVPLAAAAPFLVRAGLPYRLEGGTASFLSRVAVAGGRWTADTTLSLRGATVAGDTVALREALGMPVEDAFAALRDPNGDVTLHLALAAPVPGDTRTLPDAVARAVRDAAARSGQAPLPDGPLRIAFAPGRAELTAHGAQQIATIAKILDARPSLVVELAAPVSTHDRRWLAARALADDIEPARGFKGVLRAFGIRDQRERIRRALEDRTDGRPGRLDADDEAALRDMLAQRPPVDADRLAALVAARVTRVTTELADRHGVAPARVVVTDAAPDDSAASPAVRGRIGVDPRVARHSVPAPASEATTSGVR
jgi:hypothetical protein